MMTIRALLSTLAVLVLACCATGCGGDGNGGGGQSPPSSPPSGSVTTFNQARGFNTIVRGVAPTQDGTGDVWVVGDFTVYTDVVSRQLIRLHADGTVAQTFARGANNLVTDVVPARDGSGDVYLHGWFTEFEGQPAPGGLIRLNNDGTRDPGFRPRLEDRGFTLVHTVVAIPDGSGDLYIGGSFTSYGGTPIRHLARIHADGRLDPSFNPGSGFTGFFDGTGPGSMVMTVARMAVEEEGSHRLYVSGIFGTYQGATVPGLVRILPTGEIDRSFAIGTGPGVIVQRLAIEALYLPADGTRDILLGGRVASWNGEAVPRGLIRVHENGSLDRSFTPPSMFVFTIASAGPGTGDLYVAGPQEDMGDRVLRIAANGRPVASFPERRVNGTILALAPTRDGTQDVYAGGLFTAYENVGVSHLARIRSDGSLDPRTVRGTGFSQIVGHLEPAGEGQVYAATSGQYNGTAVRGVVRLRADGTVDPEFQFGEVRQEFVGGSVGAVTRACDASDRLYVSGHFVTYDNQPVISLMRLFPDGRLDRGFATGSGFHHILPPPRVGPTLDAPAIVCAEGNAGTLYAYGQFNRYNDMVVGHLVRLRADGTLDPSFAIGSGFDDEVLAVVPAGDGSGAVYVSGLFRTFNGQPVGTGQFGVSLVRLLATGQLDAQYRPPPDATIAEAASLDGRGDLYARSREGRLFRLRPDGSADPTFTSAPLPGTPLKILPDRQGRVLVVGQGQVVGTSELLGYVVRLTSTGAIDPAFTGDTAMDRSVWTAAEAGDGTGDVYIGGEFTRYRDRTMQGIARLTPDGSPK